MGETLPLFYPRLCTGGNWGQAFLGVKIGGEPNYTLELD